MRELVLKRIREIEYLQEDGEFGKNSSLWRFAIYGRNHISEINFDTLTDDELLDVFELIFRKYNMI